MPPSWRAGFLAALFVLAFVLICVGFFGLGSRSTSQAPDPELFTVDR